jgi:hypothetical protein
MPPCQGGSRGFESRLPLHPFFYQHLLAKEEVVPILSGSSAPSLFLQHLLAKEETVPILSGSSAPSLIQTSRSLRAKRGNLNYGLPPIIVVFFFFFVIPAQVGIQRSLSHPLTLPAPKKIGEPVEGFPRQYPVYKLSGLLYTPNTILARRHKAVR